MGDLLRFQAELLPSSWCFAVLCFGFGCGSRSSSSNSCCWDGKTWPKIPLARQPGDAGNAKYSPTVFYLLTYLGIVICYACSSSSSLIHSVHRQAGRQTATTRATLPNLDPIASLLPCLPLAAKVTAPLRVGAPTFPARTPPPRTRSLSAAAPAQPSPAYPSPAQPTPAQPRSRGKTKTEKVETVATAEARMR
jgi:hypothetical protein